MNLARKGFTLIELLVVIAIIGILAAIILPVFAAAKKSAYRSADMSNMNQLRTALQLYKADQGEYPPALLGYVTLYMDDYQGMGATIGDIVPANQLGQVFNGANGPELFTSPLFPKRVNSINSFEPSLDSGSGSAFYTSIVNPVWPNGQLGGVGNDACTGSSPAANCNMQRYGQTQPVAWCYSGDTATANSAPDPAYYYQISGYDVATVKTATGTVNELHYSLWWTGYTVPDQCNPSDSLGSGSDNPRQLGYSEPPDSTVVTWDSWFRDYGTGNVPLHQKQDIVLFLAGDARPYDSANLASQAWQVNP
jgi:prepilin-type N-terminal cleavage/methylation domain-containing protein